MPAKNIECQLAQGQIGRYLAGANMSSEAITQLEQHIAECDECTTYIDAKRSTLQEVARTRHAAVTMPDPEPEPDAEPAPPTAAPSAPRSMVGGALIQAIREKSNPLSQIAVLETAREPGAPRKTYWKALGYAAGLGAILLAMSHLAANPTALFGDRVGGASLPAAKSDPADIPASAPKVRDPFAAVMPEPKSPVTGDAANGNGAANQATPTASASAKPAAPEATANSNPSPSPISSSSSTPPAPTVTATSRRVSQTPRRALRRPAPAPRAGNSIRVYDASGKPIK